MDNSNASGWQYLVRHGLDDIYDVAWRHFRALVSCAREGDALVVGHALLHVNGQVRRSSLHLVAVAHVALLGDDLAFAAARRASERDTTLSVLK